MWRDNEVLITYRVVEEKRVEWGMEMTNAFIFLNNFGETLKPG